MQWATLPVSIVRYVDDHQPGWVVCQFADVHGRTYTSGPIKQVYVTRDCVDENTPYPVPGRLDCRVVRTAGGVSAITTDETWEGIADDGHLFEVPTSSLTMDTPSAEPGAAADRGLTSE